MPLTIPQLVEDPGTHYVNLVEKEATFQEALQHVINLYNEESRSDTPDFLLTEYLISCLNTWSYITRQRDKWYNFKTLTENGAQKESGSSSFTEDSLTPTIPTKD